MIVVVMVEQLMNYGGESVIMMVIVMGKNGEASITMKVDLAEIEQIVEKLERGEEVGSFLLSRNVYLCHCC